MNAFDALKALYLEENRRKYPDLPYRTYPNWTDNSSNGLTRMVIDFLRLSGHHCERTSNEGRVIDNRQTVTDVIGRQRMIGSVQRVRGSGMRGTSDLKAVIKDASGVGRFVAIEVKCLITKDKQRPAQIEYQRQVEQAGGLYYIARSFSEFYSWYIETFENGKT